MKSYKFENLNSIRTIAFMSTFFAHAFYTENNKILNSESFKWAIKFHELFSFGVPVFFVLSGFLITFLMIREFEETNKFNLRHFYIRRIFRIWPLYYLVILFGFFVFPIIRELIKGDAYIESATPLMYIFMLSNFDQINTGELPYGVGLGPTWSVSIEEQFYFIWPVLFAIFPGKKFKYPVLILLVFIFICCPLFHLTSKNTLFCAIYLATGAIFAYYSFYRKDLILKLIAISNFVFYMILLFLITQLYFSSMAMGGYLLIYFIAITIGYIIVFQCFSKNISFKKIPFLGRLGKYTYGLYLYHVICNFIAYTIIDDVFKIAETQIIVLVIRPILSLTFSVIISVLSYRYFESYFLRLKTKFSHVD